MTDAQTIELLEAKSREELLQIAEATGVEIPPYTRKRGIIDLILGGVDAAVEEIAAERGVSATGGADAETSAPSSEMDTIETAANEASTIDQEISERTRRVKLSDPAADIGNGASDDATNGIAREAAEPAADAVADAVAADSEEVAEEGNRRSRRRGRERDEEFQGEAAPCDGLLDLREEGYGFLRISGLLPSPDDVYVAARHVRQYGLRRGDRVTGASRPAARSEKNPALLRLDSVNGLAADPEPSSNNRPLFEDLPAVAPDTQLRLVASQKNANGDVAQRLSENLQRHFEHIDAERPLCFGQRGMLVTGPNPEREQQDLDTSVLVGELSASLSLANPDVHLLVLLIDARPEEITELTRRLDTSGEVISSALDRPAEEHVAVAELTLERAKRKAELGEDVVVVLDGLTRLARAHRRTVNYRQSQQNSDPAAVAATKALLGAARNLEDAGSITVLATARYDTGIEFDELALDECRSAANWVMGVSNWVWESNQVRRDARVNTLRNQ